MVQCRAPGAAVDNRWTVSGPLSAEELHIEYVTKGFRMSATVRQRGGRWYGQASVIPPKTSSAAAAITSVNERSMGEAVEFAEKWLTDTCSKLSRGPC